MIELSVLAVRICVGFRNARINYVRLFLVQNKASTFDLYTALHLQCQSHCRRHALCYSYHVNTLATSFCNVIFFAQKNYFYYHPFDFMLIYLDYPCDFHPFDLMLIYLDYPFSVQNNLEFYKMVPQ